MRSSSDARCAALLSLVQRHLARKPGLAVLGLCGAQGSGKSTLATALAAQLSSAGMPAATLSLDDLYLTRAERQALASRVHPLLVTRGVPGTHDVALGHTVIDALARGEPAALPRFDKATDDRAPASSWPHAPDGTRLLILEGWCIGARPQPEAAMAMPCNALEQAEDPAGVWRRHVNAALAGPYQALFARIDMLALLAAPDFEVVAGWRAQQEAALRASARPDAPGLMDGPALTRFLQHYERLTRHILLEMPGRADLVIHQNDDRTACAITPRDG